MAKKEKQTLGVMALGQFIKAICDHKDIRIYSNDGDINRIYVYNPEYNVYSQSTFTYGAMNIDQFIGYWARDIYNICFNYEIL